MATFAFDTPSLGRVRRPGAGYRLFCMPFPGSAASAFLPWAELLPPDVELCAAQLPGREDRFDEPLVTDFTALLDELVGAVAPYTDLPFAVFGHSAGALLAFELVRALQERRGAVAQALFVSAEPPPDAPRDGERLHTLDDAGFLRRLVDRGGTPPEIAGNAELMELLLPVLRADFTWCERYEYRPGPPLARPLTAFAGRHDRVVGADRVRGWSARTTGPFELHVVDGDHFFVRDAKQDVVSRIVGTLRSAPRPAGGT
ncbi:thioesterase II family protein [Streptomyces sp. TS71-3]|uniref:thioesterase II family protein n=1 Tax=Streptomyces sp. TS71-3 TaxID=2733862 RepID=UPI001BB3576E|nr:thioesterase domain-containing protein [Streptomyces sp. TS71-3]